jgi:hypothetical protein
MEEPCAPVKQVLVFFFFFFWLVLEIGALAA